MDYTSPNAKIAELKSSDHILTDKQKTVLELGLSSHIKTKYDKANENVRLEVPYQSSLKFPRNTCNLLVNFKYWINCKLTVQNIAVARIAYFLCQYCIKH